MWQEFQGRQAMVRWDSHSLLDSEMNSYFYYLELASSSFIANLCYYLSLFRSLGHYYFRYLKCHHCREVNEKKVAEIECITWFRCCYHLALYPSRTLRGQYLHSPTKVARHNFSMPFAVLVFRVLCHLLDVAAAVAACRSFSTFGLDFLVIMEWDWPQFFCISWFSIIWRACFCFLYFLILNL